MSFPIFRHDTPIFEICRTQVKNTVFVAKMASMNVNQRHLNFIVSSFG